MEEQLQTLNPLRYKFVRFWKQSVSSPDRQHCQEWTQNVHNMLGKMHWDKNKTFHLLTLQFHSFGSFHWHFNKAWRTAWFYDVILHHPCKAIRICSEKPDFVDWQQLVRYFSVGYVYFSGVTMSSGRKNWPSASIINTAAGLLVHK